MKKRSENIPLPFAILLTVGCLFMGSVFTFGMSYWNAGIDKDSCIYVDTDFVSYNEIYNIKKPGHIKEIEIECGDGNEYYIDGSCVTEDLRNKFNSLVTGKKMNFILHPNSRSTILELRIDNEALVSFEETSEYLGIEKVLFLILGILIYLISILAIISVIKTIKAKSKNA